MFIEYDNQKYSCGCTIGKQSITYKNLPDDFPNLLEGEIILFADDGFELRKDNTENYLRQTFANGTFTLTNLPEQQVDGDTEYEPSAEDMLNALVGGMSYE